uniref:Tesmin/TSO1-like CXC domain-containing protein n=1 Tax=Syphacia muris TaxID=451379 RepID=A0A0N5AW54_9BILA
MSSSSSSNIKNGNSAATVIGNSAAAAAATATAATALSNNSTATVIANSTAEDSAGCSCTSAAVVGQQQWCMHLKQSVDDSTKIVDVSIGSITEVTATMSKPAAPQFCCECIAAQNRCSTDSCPCFAARRMCDEHCESASDSKRKPTIDLSSYLLQISIKNLPAPL